MNAKETTKDAAAKYVFGVANREINKLEARIAELETALNSYRLDHKTDSYADDCTCDLCQQADKALKGTP